MKKKRGNFLPTFVQSSVWWDFLIDNPNADKMPDLEMRRTAAPAVEMAPFLTSDLPFIRKAPLVINSKRKNKSHHDDQHH